MDCYNVLLGLSENSSYQFEEKFSITLRDIIGEKVGSIKVARKVSDYYKIVSDKKDSYNLHILFDDLGNENSYSRYLHNFQGTSQVNYILLVPDNCKGTTKLSDLLIRGLYNVLYRKDVNYRELKELIFHPRSRAEAEVYYGLYYDKAVIDCVESPKPAQTKSEGEGVRRKVADGLYITRVHSLDVRKVFYQDVGDDTVTKAFIDCMGDLDSILFSKKVSEMPEMEFETEPEWVREHVENVTAYLREKGGYFFQAYETGKMSADDLKSRIADYLKRNSTLTSEKQAIVCETFIRDIASYGKLDVVINTPDVSDIRLLDKDRVTVQHKGKWYRTNITFDSKEEYEYFLNRICTKNRTAVNIQQAEIIFSDPDTNPYAKLRFTVSHSILNSSSTMTAHIRKIDKVKKTTEQLISEGFFTKQKAAFMINAIRQGKSFIVVGGSGAGKTIFLNWALEFSDSSISGVCMQESDELFSEHLTNMEFKHTMSSKGESKIEHTLLELATNALLKNVQLFVIGEIKGPEARDFLTASISAQVETSTHGESVFEGIPRLVDLAKYNSDYSEKELTKKFARHLNFVVFMDSYQVKDIAGVVGWDDERQDVVYDLYDFED